MGDCLHMRDHAPLAGFKSTYGSVSECLFLAHSEQRVASFGENNIQHDRQVRHLRGVRHCFSLRTGNLSYDDQVWPTCAIRNYIFIRQQFRTQSHS